MLGLRWCQRQTEIVVEMVGSFSDIKRGGAIICDVTGAMAMQSRASGDSVDLVRGGGGQLRHGRSAGTAATCTWVPYTGVNRTGFS